MSNDFTSLNEECLIALADYYGARRDRKAGADMYTCPVCKSGEHGTGSTGAFHIGRNKNGKISFYCHSCGRFGNIASLWCEYHGVENTKQNFPQIIRGIKSDLGMPIEDTNYQDFKNNYRFKGEITNDDLNPQTTVETEAHNFSSRFKYTLWKNQSHAVNYLKTRGIENAAKIAYDFNMGYGEYKWNGTDIVNAVFVPMFEDYNFNSEAVYSFSWRAVDQDLKKKRGKIHPLVPECLKPNSKDTTKKWVYLVEGEYDFFSILDIQYSLEKEGKTCEFSAISINSAVNLPRFIDELYQNGIISNDIGLIIALDNDKEFNQNVENFKAKGYRMAQKYRIPCIIADVKTLYLGEKDSNEALKKDRIAFEKSLRLTVEQAKLLDINTYMKECEQMEKEIQKQEKLSSMGGDVTAHQDGTQAEQPVPSIEEMLETVTEETIASTEILGYVLKLNNETSIKSYIFALENKAREFKVNNIKKFDDMCNSYEREALEKIKSKATQEYSYPDWIEVDKKGMPYQTIDNCWNILKNDSTYKGKITYNTFTNQMFLDGKLWKDSFFSKLVYHFETNYKITNENKINHAINLEADENSFHPIIDYLNSLPKWDGIPRLSTLFIDFLGTKDDKYTRAVPIVTLCGAVARVLNPGVKYDTMTVLVGKQGTGKSTFWNKLGGEWFSDNVDTIKGKEAYESIQNAWIIEFAELSALGRATIEEIKKFITKCIDKYRKPYAINSEAIPRQCIFVGTTNTYDFLRDETGNRRFYPIDIDIDKATKSIWNDLTPEYVGLLWAEAMYLYKKNGEKVIYIKDKEVLRLAELQQSEHFEKSTTYSEVEAYLTMPVPPNWNTYNVEQRQDFIARYRKDSNIYATEMRKTICVKEILVDLYPNDFNANSKIDNKINKEIVQILEALGFKFVYSSKTKLFGSQRIYRKD